MEKSDLDRFIETLRETEKDPLLRESDRGCVLQRAADLENQLQAILTDWFTIAGEYSHRDEEKLFGFAGPAGTFNAKIVLCRAAGLIRAELSQDLQRFRTLRNIAAHSSGEFSLSSAKSRSLISGMHHEFGKENKLPRYSVRSPESAEAPKNVDREHETVMKGHGFVRFDKVNFIITSLNLDIEITRAKVMAAALATAVARMRKQL